VRDCQVSLSCALRDELRKGRVLFLPPCMSCIGMMRMFMMEKRVPMSWVRKCRRMRCIETNGGWLRAIAVAQCPDWPDDERKTTTRDINHRPNDVTRSRVLINNMTESQHSTYSLF
jgi:hypothetical protein